MGLSEHEIRESRKSSEHGLTGTVFNKDVQLFYLFMDDQQTSKDSI